MADHIESFEVKMARNSCALATPDANNDPGWRSALWIALAVNAAMFVAEMIAGVAGGSRALQADALDFLGDSPNCAISLGITGGVQIIRQAMSELTPTTTGRPVRVGR